MSSNSTSSLNRRQALQGLGIAAAAAALPSRFSHAQAQAKQMKLGTYGGSWRDGLETYVSSSLRANQNINVEYVLDSPTGNLAKVIAAKGRTKPFDAMEGSPELLNQMVSAGFLEKINVDHMPNVKALPPLAISPYSITTFGVLEGIVYNEKKFQEAGVPAPERYIDLANPKLAGHVAFPEVSHTDHLAAVIGLAKDAGGDETSVEKAIPLINQIKAAYFFAASTDLSTKFGAGDIWAAPWSAGWAVRLKRSGLPIKISYPKHGDQRGTLFPNQFYFMKGSDNIESVELFLDRFTSPEVQFQFGKATGQLPMNDEARAKLSSDRDVKDLMLFSDAELKALAIIDYSKLDLVKWRETWNRQITR